MNAMWQAWQASRSALEPMLAELDWAERERQKVLDTRALVKRAEAAEAENEKLRELLSQSLIAIRNLVKEGEYNRTGNLPSPKSMDEAVKWWMRHGTQIAAWDSPKVDVQALSATPPKPACARCGRPEIEHGGEHGPEPCPDGLGLYARAATTGKGEQG